MGRNNIIQFPIGPRICPSCESEDVGIRRSLKEFPYGAGDKQVMLSVVVPVYTCRNCELSYEDTEAEGLMHEAVCQHLGVLSPREIKRIRQKYGSRAEFSRFSGIGDASVARWESGAQVQSEAMDLLLRLLSIPANLSAVVSGSIRPVQKDAIPASGSISKRFAHLKITPELENEAEKFVL